MLLPCVVESDLSRMVTPFEGSVMAILRGRVANRVYTCETTWSGRLPNTVSNTYNQSFQKVQV